MLGKLQIPVADVARNRYLKDTTPTHISYHCISILLLAFHAAISALLD
jgi:hypothetical protein